jgi:nucleoside-diphosphate-sugar epimerase
MHLETRVLVTGGAGFLGSHLCERLLKLGATIICVDNFFTGTRRNIVHLLVDRRGVWTPIGGSKTLIIQRSEGSKFGVYSHTG